MPERPTIKAGDHGCQADQDAYVAAREAELAKLLVDKCEVCGARIETPLMDLAQQPGAEVRAPSRCQACRGEGASTPRPGVAVW